MVGWIKLHRSIKESFFYQNPEALTLWIHLLLEANHADNEFMFNGTKISLKTGQLLTGRLQLSKKTQISKSKVHRLLKLFESEHQIEQQKTNKFTIITITNWGKYQQTETQDETQVKRKRNADETQVNTNKNDKELIKNEENVISTAKAVAIKQTKASRSKFDVKTSITTEQYQLILADPKLANGDKAFLWESVKQMADWSASNNKLKADWAATLRNWIRGNKKEGPRGIVPKTFNQLDRDDWEANKRRFLEKE